MNTKLCLTALLLFFPLSVFAQDRLLIGYGGFSGVHVPIWVTKEFGLLEKHQLKGELVMIPGGSRQMQALIGGSIHFSHIDSTAPITAIYRGAELVIVAGALNKFPFSIVTQKEIRQPSDLIGKRIGIVNFGGQNELSVILALREWKIPREAVNIIPSGPSDSRLVALSTRALDATLLSPPQTTTAETLGLRILAQLSDLKASFPIDTIVTSRSFLKQNRDTVKRLLRAYIDGLYAIRTQKEKTIAVLQKMLREGNRTILESTYDYYAPQFSIPPRVSREGLRTTADFLAPKAGAGDIERFLDESVLDELEREGLFKTYK
jgi:ABC-type nitrate/sulfonate/bicarbonate transport system substrate-binding protein